MLDIMRRNAQSWLVKVLFAAIVIVFVFWGIGSFTDDRSDTLAVVNDQPLKLQDFVRTYESTAQALREQNPEIDRDDLRAMQLRQQVFSQLINTRLLVQKAEELGLSVSREELQQAITSLPAFRDEDNIFDPQRYEMILRSHQLTPARFEHDYRHNLLMDKVEKYVAMPARASEQEVREFFNYARSTMKIDYLLIEPGAFLDQVELQENMISEHYTANMDQFMQPEKISIAYIKLTPDALARTVEVSEEEIEAYYLSQPGQFTEPERLSARHILIAADLNASPGEQQQAREKIEQLENRLEQGEDFAELAREYSDCPSADQGGDLGSFTRNQMVPAFEEAAFGLEPGQISAPVQTRFGWHLIKAEDYQDARTRDLEEVEDDIRNLIGRDRAVDALGDYADDVLEILVTQGTLQEAADSLGLELRRTDLFSMDQPPAGLGLTPQALQRLFDLDEGQTTEMPVMLDDGYFYAQKTDFREARVAPLKEVEQEIRSRLKRSEAEQLARQAAEEKRARIMEGALNLEDLDLRTSEPFTRQGFIPELGMNRELASQAFAAGKNSWLPDVHLTDAGYVLARVVEQTIPGEDEFQREKEQWMRSHAEAQRQLMFSSFISMLRNEAQIKLLRPEVLEY